MSILNVATVASDTVWKNIHKNIEQTKQHVSEVMNLRPKTQVILFPEISLAGFVVDASNVDLAETMSGNAVAEIQKTAKKFRVALICGMIEKNLNGKPFNTQFVISAEGKLASSYQKNHLFTQSAEPDLYTVGTRLATFNLGGWKCGLSTCFDIRFPRLFEAYKKAGVECLFAGFNWVEGRNKAEAMKILVTARAHENQFFMVAVDRSGSDPNTRFYGQSVVANPFAEEIATSHGIYSFASLDKDAIKQASNSLPLSDSFKSKYSVHQNDQL